MQLSPEEWIVLKKLLLSDHVQFGIAAALEKDLTEEEDMILWDIIKKVEKETLP